MSGPATASQAPNFLPSQQQQHPLQHPHQLHLQHQQPLQQPHQQHQHQHQHQQHASPSPAAGPIDQFGNSSTPRGQVNAWGWPSGFNNNQIPASNVAGPSKPHFQQASQPAQATAMYNGQQQQQQQQPSNHTGGTVYPPQPYGVQQSFTTPAQGPSSLPAAAAQINPGQKTKMVGNAGVNTSGPIMRKRNASNSPEGEGKDKRSRPDDSGNGNGNVNNRQSPSVKNDQSASGAERRAWGEEATKLDVYVWDYLSRRGFAGAARALMSEAGMAEPPEVPLKTPQGLLFEYWAIFWDVFAARTGRGSAEATAYFEYQESRQMQRLVDASRKSEMLEASYQAPDNSGRFPTITVAGVPVDPAVLAGRPVGQPTWNPAALPQAQQQQLLITAAQRQNIPIHEIKNLTPATRMALINSMNPNNPANQQALRNAASINNQQMEQQMQVRLQQQQALHRMMQQQRQGGPAQQMAAAAAMQARPPALGPQSAVPMTAGSPAHGGVGTPGIPDGRRSVGPISGPQPDPNRPEQAPGVLPTTQLPMQPGSGPPPPQPQQQVPGQPPQPQPGQQQHMQLNPQQQQAVLNQYQSVQASMREEWMKAQNAPSPAAAQDFYANVQQYQTKAQSLQALLRAQVNYQPQVGPPQQPQSQQAPQTQPQSHLAQQLQQQQQHHQQQQQQLMQMQGRPGGPQMAMGAPGAQTMPISMANLTPQQRAAQIANAQAAAGRIPPAMANHDTGVMNGIMAPGGMPNGNLGGPRAPTPHDGASQQQPMSSQGQPPGPGSAGPGQGSTAGFDPNDARARAMHQPGTVPGNAGGTFQQAQQQQGGPARTPSSQGRMDDNGQNHFGNQSNPSPAGAARPNMQRTASSQVVGGMGPPGPQSISSPSPRTQPGNLQQQSSQQQNAQAVGSPAGNVPSTPKMGAAEKSKKGPARQRNTKAGGTTKTPTLSAAPVPGSNGSANPNGPGTSTPAQAQTPASASAATPGRDGQAAQTPTNKPNGSGTDGSHAASQQPSSLQPQASPPASGSQPAQPPSQSMPPPGVPAPATQTSSSLTGDANAAFKPGGTTNGDLSNPSGDGSGNGSGGLSNDDFSMFGFGGSMNDIFDFDLSTDGAGGGSGGLGGDAWDSNFGGLFSGGDGMSGGS